MLSLANGPRCAGELVAYTGWQDLANPPFIRRGAGIRHHPRAAAAGQAAGSSQLLLTQPLGTSVQSAAPRPTMRRLGPAEGHPTVAWTRAPADTGASKLVQRRLCGGSSSMVPSRQQGWWPALVAANSPTKRCTWPQLVMCERCRMSGSWRSAPEPVDLRCCSPRAVTVVT